MSIDEVRESYSNLNLSVSIANWDAESRTKFVLHLLKIMSSWTESKLDYFWKPGDESNALKGWVDCLQVFTGNALLNAVESVQDCNYRKYEDSVPRSPIDFKFFILNGVHGKYRRNEPKGPEIIKYMDFDDEDGSQEKSREVAKENLKKIREMLRCGYKTVGAENE